LIWAWLWACGADPTPSVSDAGDDAPTADTDTDIAGDSHTDDNRHTDVDSDTDDSVGPNTQPSNQDSAAPAPSALLGAFVPTASAVLAQDPVWMFVGDRAARVERSMSVGWTADVDEDGTEELVVSAHHPLSAPPDVARVRAYDLDAALQPALDLAATAALEALGDNIAGLVDLDGDGHLDALLDRPGRGVAWGTGPNAFLPPSALMPRDDTWATSTAFGLVDADQDGWLDLLVGERSCTNPAVAMLLLRTGAQRLERDANAVAPGRDALGWTLFPVEPVAGVEMLGLPAGPCQRPDSHAGFLVRSETPDGRPVYTEQDVLPSNALFRLDPAVAGGPVTLEVPMGGVMADLDGSGTAEVLLAHDTRWNETFEWVDGAFVDRRWSAPQPVMGAQGAPMYAWGMAAIDVDRDRLPDLVFAAGDDATTYFNDLIGLAHPMVWRSTGGFGFEDLTAGSGLEVWGSWRSVAVSDPDGDGDADLVVGGNGWAPELFRDDVTSGYSASLRLRGTTSNHLGVGARVRLRDGLGPEAVYVMGGAGSPELLASPWIFLGLGDQPVAPVEIVWPSGLVQLVELAGGTSWTVVEPETVSVSPATRRVIADGVSTVTVRVQPRTPAGDPDPLASAEIELAVGAATWAGPVERDGDGWSRTLRAPARAGEAVVAVSINGVASGVRPRLWFDAR